MSYEGIEIMRSAPDAPADPGQGDAVDEEFAGIEIVRTEEALPMSAPVRVGAVRVVCWRVGGGKEAWGWWETSGSVHVQHTCIDLYQSHPKDVHTHTHHSTTPTHTHHTHQVEEDYGGFKVVREGPTYIPPTPIEGVSVSPSGYAPPQPAQPHPSTPPKVPGKAPKRPPIYRPETEDDGVGDIDLDFVLDPELDLDTAPMGLHIYPSGEATFRWGG